MFRLQEGHLTNGRSVVLLVLFTIACAVLLTLYMKGNNLSAFDIQTELSLDEWKKEIKFEFTPIEVFPFSPNKTKATVEYYEYGKDWIQKGVASYFSEDLHFNFIITNDAMDVTESFEALSVNGLTVYYAEDAIAQKLWFMKDNIWYGCIYFLYKGQPVIEKEEYLQLANQF